MPVRNYAPELLELFRRGAAEPVRIKLDDYAQAVTYRHRLHNLRKTMRTENHHLLAIAEGVMLTIEGDKGTSPVFLVAKPADTGLVAALRQSGIEVEAAEPAKATPHPAAPPPADEPIPYDPFASESALEAFKTEAKPKTKAKRKKK